MFGLKAQKIAKEPPVPKMFGETFLSAAPTQIELSSHANSLRAYETNFITSGVREFDWHLGGGVASWKDTSSNVPSHVERNVSLQWLLIENFATTPAFSRLRLCLERVKSLPCEIGDKLKRLIFRLPVAHLVKQFSPRFTSTMSRYKRKWFNSMLWIRAVEKNRFCIARQSNWSKSPLFRLHNVIRKH